MQLSYVEPEVHLSGFTAKFSWHEGRPALLPGNLAPFTPCQHFVLRVTVDGTNPWYPQYGLGFWIFSVTEFKPHPTISTHLDERLLLLWPHQALVGIRIEEGVMRGRRGALAVFLIENIWEQPGMKKIRPISRLLQIRLSVPYLF